ncbi:hypothetical protein VTN00DRAFT_7491 [Thermoascus crustaceus]|uniref:uncharacterized protein n=1 Tax=Thermoascus crustaceus TaxID=5088 RepID=UPI003743856D
MLFSKAILLLSAAVAPFALAAGEQPAPHTVTIKVINATPTPSSTPVYTPSPTSSKVILSTGTGAIVTPTGGRWNSTTSSTAGVKGPSSAIPATGGAAAGAEMASAVVAGVVAVAGLVVL